MKKQLEGPEACVREQEQLPRVAALVPQSEFSPPFQVYSKYLTIAFPPSPTCTSIPLPRGANRRTPTQASSWRYSIVGIGTR